jgi:hypothetical protein
VVIFLVDVGRIVQILIYMMPKVFCFVIYIILCSNIFHDTL